jgi:hypothetical protein
VIAVLAAMLLNGPLCASGTCHIHPPGSTPQRPIGLIGPFASVADCERERVRRFGDGGRCHCVADFTPDWLPAEPGTPADDDPARLL